MSSTSNMTAVQEVFNRVHSSEGLSFPVTVQALLDLGVTRYFVDYVAGTATCYSFTPSTSESAASSHAQVVQISSIFDREDISGQTRKWNSQGIANAIQGAQRGEGNYEDFSSACMRSGVVGYHAFLTGQRVMYFGSAGDFHVEWFPGAGPKKQEDK